MIAVNLFSSWLLLCYVLTFLDICFVQSLSKNPVPETLPLPVEPEEEEDPQADEFVSNVVVTPKSMIEIADEVGSISFVFGFLWS